MDMVHLTPVARGVLQFHVVHDSFRNLLVYLFMSSLWSDDFLDRQCSRQGRRCEHLPPYQNIASHSLEYSLGHVESSDLVREVATH